MKFGNINAREYFFDWVWLLYVHIVTNGRMALHSNVDSARVLDHLILHYPSYVRMKRPGAFNIYILFLYMYLL